MRVNLDQFFDDQKPVITIFGKNYEVDNDVKTVLKFQSARNTLEDNDESIKEFLGLALGDNAADEILSHHFPFSFFEVMVKGIAACMTGHTLDEVSKAADSFRS